MIYINNSDALKTLMTRLSTIDRVAIDTEFMRERTYYPMLSLIQLAWYNTEGELEIACIDPLEIEDLSELATMLANPQCEKVIHAMSQDIEALLTRSNVKPCNFFDTQLALAMTGGGDQVGYAGMVMTLFDVHLGKTQTRTDWTIRPLSDEQIGYAQDDVRYLLEAADQLSEQLRSLQRMNWFVDDMTMLLNQALSIDPMVQCIQRFKGGARLSPIQQQYAATLVQWREREAMSHDVPREWVLPQRVILNIAFFADRYKGSLKLERIEGMSPKLVKRCGEEIISLLMGVEQHANEYYLVWPDERQSSGQRKRVKNILAWLRQEASMLDLPPSLIFNRRTIEDYVTTGNTAVLQYGWRGEVAGNFIVREFGVTPEEGPAQGWGGHYY